MRQNVLLRHAHQKPHKMTSPYPYFGLLSTCLNWECCWDPYNPALFDVGLVRPKLFVLGRRVKKWAYLLEVWIVVGWQRLFP